MFSRPGTLLSTQQGTHEHTYTMYTHVPAPSTYPFLNTPTYSPIHAACTTVHPPPY